MSNSPWMRGASQVGFSATILGRVIPLGICLLTLHPDLLCSVRQCLRTNHRASSFPMLANAQNPSPSACNLISQNRASILGSTRGGSAVLQSGARR